MKELTISCYITTQSQEAGAERVHTMHALLQWLQVSNININQLVASICFSQPNL